MTDTALGFSSGYLFLPRSGYRSIFKLSNLTQTEVRVKEAENSLNHISEDVCHFLVQSNQIQEQCYSCEMVK